MALDHAVRLVMTDGQLLTLKALIAATDEAPGATAVISFWKMMTPDAWEASSETEKLDTTGWAIPEHQWHEICQAVTERANQLHPYSTEGVSAPLTWMNNGPSAYQDGE